MDIVEYSTYKSRREERASTSAMAFGHARGTSDPNSQMQLLIGDDTQLKLDQAGEEATPDFY